LISSRENLLETMLSTLKSHEIPRKSPEIPPCDTSNPNRHEVSMIFPGTPRKSSVFHGFPIVFPWFSHGFPHEMPVFHRAMARASPGHAAALSQRCADLAAKLSRERQRCPGNSVNQRSFGVKLAESAKSMDI